MGYKLENTLLELEVSAQGAELQSVKNKRTGFEYLWQGNPAYWKRRSPFHTAPTIGNNTGERRFQYAGFPCHKYSKPVRLFLTL